MRMTVMTLSIVCFGVYSTAQAKQQSLLNVNFSSKGDVLQFSFSSKTAPVKLDQFLIERDSPKRLKFTIDGHKCRRGWQKKWKGEGIKRSLLYPSKKTKRCFLKVRMKRKISDDQVAAIQKMETETGVTVKFAWNPELIKPVPLSTDQEEEPEAEFAELAPSLVTTPVDDEEKTQEEATDTNSASSQTLELKESKVDLVDEAPVGDYPNMEVARDKFGIQERPHSVIETITIGQVEKARAFSPAPVILSTPISVLDDEYSSNDELFLSRATILFTKLFDQEAKARGGAIWVLDQNLRHQVKTLNTNVPKLSLSQERLVAQHAGANLISRTQMTLTPNQGDTAYVSLAVSMEPVSEEGSLQDIDPGVYRVEHNLSKAMIEEALNQTWIEQKREEAIVRSLLLPGWGHIHRGEKRLGWTYLSMSMSLALGAIISASLGYVAAKDYEDNNPSNAHRRDDANAHYDRANLLWMGLGALYTTSLVDTFISAEDRSYIDLNRLNWDQARRTVEEKRGQ